MATNKHGQRNSGAPQVETKPKPKERSVTPAMLLDYLNSKNEDATCSFCKHGDYGIASDPSGECAPLVSTPVPHVKGLGMWLYSASCLNCGHTIFFHAPFVASKILEK